MKAVIMAGGKGTRLRPLTWHLPKPMVPLLDRPCMEYIINLLKRHGITEIAVTVQYLPQVIKNHFGDGSDYGVKLHFFEETTPLGTAGSVKNAEEFLDETFLVVSGDALTDFNLSQAIAFHREKQAMGTLVLTQVEVPLEYGVVMTAPDGKIVRFLEKPSWSEVFSDTVNTGIYVLEPEIFRFFDKGQEFDFSKNLFPLLMKNEYPLYGYVAEGYWSDIGNLNQYRQTQFDMLDGLVDVEIQGKQHAPGVWMGEGVQIHPTARVDGPAFIGGGTTVEAGATLLPYTVLGRFNRIEQSAVMGRTVLWNRSYIGASAELQGAMLCNGITIGSAAHIHENVVIGKNSEIGEQAVINPGVKIWPEKTVGAGTVLQSSLIWANTSLSSLFGPEGITGIPNFDLTPEFALKMASAYGSCLERGSTVSVSCDGHPYGEILKYSVASGLLAVGIQVRDTGKTLAPIARYECRCSNSVGGIHIRKAADGRTKALVLQFFDQDGLPIDKGMERKIENTYVQEDFARPDVTALGWLEQCAASTDSYIRDVLAEIDHTAVQSSRLTVVYACENPQEMVMMHRVFGQLGCQIITVVNENAPLSNIVQSTRADMGIHVHASGETLQLITEEGRILSESEVFVLQAMIGLKKQSTMAIPVTAPSILKQMTEEADKRFIRTKAASRSLLEVNKTSTLQIHHDAFYTIVSVLEYLAKEHVSLHSVIENLPDFYIAEDVVECPIEAKGRVMRRLMEDLKGKKLELVDGIKVLLEDGWALVLPDANKANFKVVAEGSSLHEANKLTEMYRDKIVAYQQG